VLVNPIPGFPRSSQFTRVMLFYSFFKTLVGKTVTVELKNDLAITGTLHSVDQVRATAHEETCAPRHTLT
jgi:LSM domain